MCLPLPRRGVLRLAGRGGLRAAPLRPRRRSPAGGGPGGPQRAPATNGRAPAPAARTPPAFGGSVSPTPFPPPAQPGGGAS